MTDTPFSIWWKSYPGLRKKDKKKCQKLFEAYPDEVQRIIWVDTQERKRDWHDWQDEQYICAPIVYLRAEYWETPVEKCKTKKQFARDTTNEKVNPMQEKQGLDRLEQMVAQKPYRDAVDALKQMYALLGKSRLIAPEQTEETLQERKRELSQQSEDLQ